jgi:hypothetical protein
VRVACNRWEGLVAGKGGLITVRRASNRSAVARRRGREVRRGFEGLKEGVGGYGFQVNGSYGVLDVDLSLLFYILFLF